MPGGESSARGGDERGVFPLQRLCMQQLATRMALPDAPNNFFLVPVVVPTDGVVV